MARRKDDSFVNVCYEVFMGVPAWLCLPAAGLMYLLVQVTVGVLASKNSIIAPLASSAPMFGGMLAVLVLLAGFKAAVDKHSRRKLLDKQTGLNSIRQLSWSSFELLVGEAYRRQGYDVIETGGGGADGGIDLKLLRNGTTTLVQCKQWRIYKVGVKPIRELYGVMMAERADYAIFVTSGVYTREAKEFAKGKPMELLDGEALPRLIEPVQNQSSTPVRLNEETRASVPASSVSDPAPCCPRCNNDMVLRTAKRGSNAGAQFWGCSSYPRCKEIKEFRFRSDENSAVNS